MIAFDMTFTLPESSEALQMLSKLKSEHVSPGQRQTIEALWKQADVDAQFSDSLKQAGNVVLGHVFLDAERAQYADPKKAEDYFNIIWAKAFPQVLKAGPGKFDLNRPGHKQEAWWRKAWRPTCRSMPKPPLRSDSSM